MSRHEDSVTFRQMLDHIDEAVALAKNRARADLESDRVFFLALQTRPDPRTGVTLLVLDPLEWIHRITSHIPNAGRHGQRFYGAYSNRARVVKPCAPAHSADSGAATHSRGENSGNSADAHDEADNSDLSREAPSTWARLVRKIFEADPLLSPCGARMRIVSFITAPPVIDRILRHLQSERCEAKDPFEPRAPPRAHGGTPQ